MFGLLKKALPGAKERFLSADEAKAAEAWIEQAKSGNFDVVRDVSGMTERQVTMLFLVTQYSIEERGRPLMQMERFGIIGFMSSQISEFLQMFDPEDFQEIRESMIKIYLPLANDDQTMDIRGLFFDIKFKYDY